MTTSETTVSTLPSRDELFTSCQHIATKPNILGLFIQELNRAGFAGEERLSRLIFLALVTRVFKDPVSIAVKGPSSAGKSHTTQQVLNFFPTESYYAMTSMSEKALAYLNEPLKNRFLVIYEAEGMNGRTASYFIRSLLSEGCIKHSTLNQTRDDGWKLKTLYVEGPTGLLTTTTLPSLHAENETRLLSVPVNDSPEQTSEIMKAIALDEARPQIDYVPWHAFQHWLAAGTNGVSVPYAERLAATTFSGAVRLRRDFRKVISLVKAHALVHQQSRPRGEDGAVQATLQDYAVVRDLVADLIAEAAEQTVSDSLRATVKTVETQSRMGSAGISVTVLAKLLGIDKSTASRRADVAVEKGYLRNLEERPGIPARLILGDPLPEEQEVLPQPQALAA
jgi:hypothetical protein